MNRMGRSIVSVAWPALVSLVARSAMLCLDLGLGSVFVGFIGAVKYK